MQDEKSLIELCEYEITRYELLVKRMNSLISESKKDFESKTHAEIRKKCYSMFVKDLKFLLKKINKESKLKA